MKIELLRDLVKGSGSRLGAPIGTRYGDCNCESIVAAELERASTRHEARQHFLRGLRAVHGCQRGAVDFGARPRNSLVDAGTPTRISDNSRAVELRANALRCPKNTRIECGGSLRIRYIYITVFHGDPWHIRRVGNR